MSTCSSPSAEESELAVRRKHIGRSRSPRARVDTNVLRRIAVASRVAPDVERNCPLLARWALFFDAGASIQFARPQVIGRTAQYVTTSVDAVRLPGEFVALHADGISAVAARIGFE